MKSRKSINENRIGQGVIIILLTFTSSLPLLCGYFMDGGVIQTEMDWMAFRFGIQREDYGTLLVGYCVYVTILLVLNACSAYIIGMSVTNNRWVRVVSVAVYMSLPCKLYMLYDLQSLRLAGLYTLIQVLIAISAYVSKIIGKYGRILQSVGSLIIWISTIVISRFFIKKYHVDYEFLLSQKTDYEIPYLLESIVYRDALPGIGFVLAGILILLLYMSVIEKKKVLGFNGWICVLIGLICLAISTSSWQVSAIKRGVNAFMGIELYGFEYVTIGVLLMGMPAVKTIDKYVESEENHVYRVIIPIVVSMVGCFTAIYLCNMLTYTRMPIGG